MNKVLTLAIGLPFLMIGAANAQQKQNYAWWIMLRLDILSRGQKHRHQLAV